VAGVKLTAGRVNLELDLVGIGSMVIGILSVILLRKGLVDLLQSVARRLAPPT
jgi:hypothetical protein